MSDGLEDFYHEFFQDVLSAADADGRFTEDSFFDLFCDQLIDAGEIETADRAHYQSPKGIRLDGYGGDPASNDGELCLIVADFAQSPTISTLTASELDAIFKRLTGFLKKALEPSFREGLEETSPAFGVADMICRRWSTIEKVRCILISNRVLSSRVEGREASEIEGTPVTFTVWDIGRLHRFVAAGHGREEIEINLVDDYGGALPALPAHLSEAGYEAYLIVIPGAQLAAIYDHWGARLLEQNVRVFLQARGSVNKGIRSTIENNPEMFFAYNNGITATAEEVVTDISDGLLSIKSIKNLQIVNGGQTTASIHAASRKKEAGLHNVFVQMKLSIVAPEKAMEIVPKISEFANSQNKVNAADFFANHPFHVRMEEFSRRVFSPSPDGTFKESKWFYERARGQYQDARSLLSVAQRRKFDGDFPKSQLISKTDLAKVLNPWRGFPEIVSRGSQKNFVHFADSVGKDWDKTADSFNESFFRDAIAKAIVFRETENLVTRQPWYQGGGIRSRVVPYAIAKLAYDADKVGEVVDLEKVWRRQSMPDALTEALTVAAEAVHNVIMGTASEIPNPLEWAKQQACWARVKTLKVEWPENWKEVLQGKDDQRSVKRSAVKDQKMLNGIEAQSAVLKAGGPFWSDVRTWGLSKKLLSPIDAGILAVAAAMPAKLPSEKQALIAIKLLQKMRSEGFKGTPTEHGDV